MSSIYDYAPYKALNLPIGLFGPAPCSPTLCEQEEERAWFRRCQFWQQQQAEFAKKQQNRSMHILQEFEHLQDLESSIGCHSCEKNHRSSCRCACDGCDSKYCNGDCACENEWVY